MARADSIETRRRIDDSVARAARLADTIPDRAEVVVCVERRDSLNTYHYQVRNMTRKQGVVWMLGYGNTYPTDSAANPLDGSDLSTLPLQAIWEKEERRLRPEGYTVPSHWEAELGRVEETEGFFIEFSADTTPKHAIPPRSVLSGFSVTVAGADSAYRTGRWILYILGPGDFAGRLREVPCDSVRGGTPTTPAR